MCRVLTYMGHDELLDDLLYNPDSSLIKQTYNPIHMQHMLNLGGFGMAAWNRNSFHPNNPFLYKTAGLPFFDNNIRNLSSKLRVDCLIAHVRGVPYSSRAMVVEQNVHPFLFPDCQLAMAHNGTLTEIDKLKPDLLKAMPEKMALNIKGTTDTEWMYALLMSQFKHPDDQNDIQAVAKAVINMLKILRQLRKKNNTHLASPINLFISNGKFIIATRFVFDYGVYAEHIEKAHWGYHSMWYTFGEHYGYYDGEYKMKGRKRQSIIISSEPLTQDTTTWLEVPEYSIVMAWRDQNKKDIRFITKDLDV